MIVYPNRRYYPHLPVSNNRITTGKEAAGAEATANETIISWTTPLDAFNLSLKETAVLVG